MAPLLATTSTAVNEFDAHADYRTATAFVLGLLALLALRCLLLAPRCRRSWHACRTLVVRLTADPAHAPGTPEASPEPAPVTPADPYYALACLNAYVLAWTLSFFGTTLLFTQSASRGCQFLGTWSTLTFQGARLLCFAILGLSIHSDAVGAHVYELWFFLGYLVVRVGLAIATTAIDFFQLQAVSLDAAICEIKTNLVWGAVVESLDLAVTLLLLLRFLISTAKADTACKTLRGWRVWARATLNQSVVKCLSVLLWIVASFAGSLGTTSYAGSWIPSALALLVVLTAYNTPPEVRTTEPAATLPHTKDLKILAPFLSSAKLAQYNESKINANVPPPSAPSTAAKTKFLTPTRVSTSNDALRQKPLPSAAYFGLPPVPIHHSTEKSFLQSFRLSCLVDPAQDKSDDKQGLPERPQLARVHGDASWTTLSVRKLNSRQSTIQVKRATQILAEDLPANSKVHHVADGAMIENANEDVNRGPSVEVTTITDDFTTCSVGILQHQQLQATLPLQFTSKKQGARLTIDTDIAKAYHVETEK